MAMGRYPRFIPERATVEVTNRTLQGRYLLRPGRELSTRMSPPIKRVSWRAIVVPSPVPP